MISNNKLIFKQVLKTLPFIFVLIFIDQISKYLLINFLKTQPFYVYNIFPCLNLVYFWNYGVSFGMFSDYYSLANNIFLFTNIVLVIFLIYLLIASVSKLLVFAYIFVIGGAIGNIFDRIIRGAVFDFIHINLFKINFPVFNFADLFINIGVLILVYDSLKNYFHKKKIN